MTYVKPVKCDKKAQGPKDSVLPYVAAFFFVLTFLIKAFVDEDFQRGSVSTTVAYSKYATACIACFAGLVHGFKTGEHVFVKQFDGLLAIFGLFSVMSAICMFRTGIFSSNVVIELVKFVIPVVLAYAILNSIDQESMYKCMIAVLIVSLVGYLIELGKSGVSIADLMNADFSNSESATESSSFSGISMVLTFYFAFFNKRNVWLFLSASFCILTFKRLAIVFALLALASSLICPKLMRIRLSKEALTLIKVLTVITVAVWAWLLLPEQQDLATSLFGKDPRQFTMGRSMTFRYLLETNFQSYGFGSANEVVRRAFAMPFELDLIKIALELSPITMIVFICLYWDVAGSTAWGVFIISFFMLNMITSDSLTSNFCLTLAYITCGLVDDAVPFVRQR